MLAPHGVERAGGGGGTEGTARTGTGTVGTLCGMQPDAEVGALFLESVYGVWDGGEVARGKGDVFVVRVVVVAGSCAQGRAEGEELDGGFKEVSEMKVSDREHWSGVLSQVNTEDNRNH